MKKAGIIALGGGILAAGIGASLVLFMPKENIELSIEGNKITWVDKSRTDLIGSKYHIYNDEFLVNKVTDQSYFLTKEKLIDEVGPEKVQKVSINYNNDSIYFTWEDVTDLGTDNSIWVSLYNKKDRQIGYSNTINMNFASGVYKYIVELKGVEYEVWDRSFSIDMSQLNNGITIAKLYAVDNRGNIGDPVNIPLYNYKVILSKEADNLRFHIDDSTQKYMYKAIINGVDIGYIENDYELNSLLEDKVAPSEVNEVDIKTGDRYANITWEDVEDNGGKYTVRIDAYGLSYYNSSSSDEMEIDKNTGLKGYHYAINNSSKYDVTDKDTFINKSDVDFVGEYGKHYFHIASIDNSGNISKTKTFKFELKDASIKDEVEEKPDYNDKPNIPSDESGSGNLDINTKKKELIESLLKTVGQVQDSSVKKAVRILENVPESILNEFKREDIKIYLTSGEAEDTYVSLTGTSTESITGAFIWGGSKTAIICETAYIDSTLLHEVGHATDYVLGGGGFISDGDSFSDIYNEEKDLLFADNSYIRESKNEYFAETFSMYYNQNYQLRTKAPKTYNYIKNKLK